MKNASKKLIAFVFALTLGACVANADQNGHDYQPLHKIAELLVKDASAFEVRPLIDPQDQNSVRENAKLVAALQNVASEQSNIWADTILEGDYLADGKTRLDLVEGVYQQERLVAYRIHYSERAWETLECDAEKDVSRESCTEGRIREATLVSPSLESWMRDELAYATFE